MRGSFVIVKLGSVILLVASACQFTAWSESAEDPPPPPPGTLIDIGGYRLHAVQHGRGEPPVIFIAGAGDGSMHWSLVQPEVARFTHTLAYDRAGFAWSDAGPVPRTLLQEAYELHLLLARLRLKPPYVLVGHSLGGLVARRFAEEYPDEVAGMVLVDATDPDTTLFMGSQENGQWVGKLVRVRETAKGKTIPRPQTIQASSPLPPTAEDRRNFEQLQKMMGPPKMEPPFDRLPISAQAAHLWAKYHPKLQAPGEDYLAEELARMFQLQQTNPRPLGNRPLIVLTGRLEKSQPPGAVSTHRWEEVMAEKKRQKEEMARLSSNGRFVQDDKSGHHIQLDDPVLVVSAIREVVTSARTGAPLAVAPGSRNPSTQP